MSNIESGKPARILMLVDGLDITNGVSVTAEEIAKHWSIVGSGYQLMVYGTSVVTLKDKTYKDACIRVEKSIMRVPVIGYKRMWLSIPVFELMKLFLSKDYDVIHSATPGPIGVMGAVFAKIFHVPLVMTHHTRMVDYMNYYAPKGFRNFLTKIAMFLFRWFYSMSDITIAHSPATVEELEELKTPDIRYIPMGVVLPYNDLEILKKDKERAKEKIRQEYGISDDRKVIMYIGRMAKEKNLDYIGEVSRKMNHAFVIVGDGPVRKRMKKYSKLILPGFRYGTDLRDMYLAADIFLCTSTSETLGKTILEALAHGVPVLVPDKGYHNSILTEQSPAVHKFGWGNPSWTLNNIIHDIDEMIKITLNKPDIASLSFEYVAQYSWDRIIPMHIDPYRELV